MFYEHRAMEFRINRKTIIKSENKTVLMNRPEQQERRCLETCLKKNQLMKTTQRVSEGVQQSQDKVGRFAPPSSVYTYIYICSCM